MPSGIGETLRAARRQQGVSLADAAAETRVRESYLAALEEEDFAALGGGVYVKGFLRSYARFLRLDPEPLLDAYRLAYERHDDDSRPLAPATVAPMPAERRPALVVAAGVVVLALVLLAVIGLIGGDEPAAEDVAGVPEPVETQTLPPAVVPTESGELEPTEAQGEPFDDLEVTFEVTGEASWMRVTVDGEVELEGELPGGSEETYEADEEIVLRVGDASAVAVTVNGEHLGELGEPAKVVDVRCEIGETACEVEEV